MLDNNDAIQAAVLRRLLAHLDEHKEVQNIELMNLADFCRNCLAKWTVAEAQEQGLNIEYAAAQEFVYGMPYAQWKSAHQLPATDEQMAMFNAKQEAKGNKS
jgi:hypothetical protein